MQISLIVALSENRCIGIENRLPWKQSADLQHFKKLTLGKPVVMGRKTFESIGRPLPDRQNIILSRDPNYRVPDCIVTSSFDAAIKDCVDSSEVMIIGGGELFKQTLPLAQRLYLTWIHATVEGDAFFPELDSTWQEQSREDHQADERNQFAYSFVVLERRQGLMRARS